MNDIFGQALLDYFKQIEQHPLWINNKYGPKEEMPVDVYFREEEEMPDLELLALNECRGNVLDIGAGAGSHALILQQRDIEVTALDISAYAVDIMHQRGVKKVIQKDIFEFNTGKYDTLLLLMNGIGLTGNLIKLKFFLQHAKELLSRGGQLLFDSSDIAYLYNGNPPADGYYGELWYQYVYKKQRTDWFQWLYIDKGLLKNIADETGWITEILYEDEMDQYLARLVLK
ncbi:class I SAM-dependent methyltransferase [Mucilaginibacter segetis]|uniref:Class I SAM-dependent methyltransferase n=1 Tax=Mucilaginibacter segetis TaxID=2793071 RepID=A0A934PT32_9SPHI|nr:methyltransferase domain-containing protein [Mucilaginibacter segetis]MBK0379097.1 class I SAM-dependent methyltransferase [Mucilaginibacter segetis]